MPQEQQKQPYPDLTLNVGTYPVIHSTLPYPTLPCPIAPSPHHSPRENMTTARARRNLYHLVYTVIAALVGTGAGVRVAFGTREGQVELLTDSLAARVKLERARLLDSYTAEAFAAISPREPPCSLVRAFKKLLGGHDIVLAVFGSSVTAGGGGVGERRAFPSLLAKSLNKLVAGHTQGRVPLDS